MNVGVFRRNWVALLFTTPAILGLVPYPALAQSPSPLPKVFEQKVKIQAVKMSMDEILAAITKQVHVSILVDDEPILQQADAAVDGSLHDALDKVSDTFDYFWSVSKSGVVLMSKRFFHPDERPQLNLPEMVEMAQSMVKALTMVEYDKDETHWKDLVKQVYQSLTPAQMKVLDSGERLHGSDLEPKQRALLKDAILSNTFLAGLRLWAGVLPSLNNMDHSSLRARTRNEGVSGADSQVHEYLFSYRGKNGQLKVIQIPRVTYVGGGERYDTP